MTVFSSTSVAERIWRIQEQLPETVRLIAVTKQVPVALMREAYAAGVRDFGESRVQEAIAKQAELKDLPEVTWHLIGHLQANKARKAVEHFQWIHSVDSLKLARRLSELATETGEHHQPNLCLQVKLLPDPSKQGWSVSELFTDLPTLNQYKKLKIRGLMAIPPLGLDSTALDGFFQEAQVLAHNIQQLHLSQIQIQELSMGMSDDYPLAVKRGATMVRLGRILFGDRG